GSGVSAWDYWLTQGDAIVRYLVLSVWPYPLVFEYGPFLVTLGEALPFLVITAALAGATFVALWRVPWAGFLGLWFFALLAPTSLMPGTTQMIVEHRMYLPLAAVSVVIVLALHAWLGRGSFLPLAGLAAALALATVARNQDYRSELALWSATVAERPRNALAHANLGIAYVRLGRVEEALRHYETAAQLGPRYPTTHYNHGLALVQAGRREDALAAFLRATTLKTDFSAAQAEAGLLLLHLGRNTEAIACCEQALRVNPDDAGTHCTLANALFLARRVDEAFDHYGAALRLAPDSADTHYNRGNSLYLLGRWTEAAADYRRALLLRPEFPEARRNLEIAQARLRSAR
ncbi:MAG TPA: tetratricopeptide repeat protein, partial [Opitutaceae bacterium]